MAREFSWVGVVSIVFTLISLSLSVSALVDNHKLINILNSPINNISSPSNTISPDQILVYNKYTLINKSNLIWFTVKNTGSMKPFIDSGNYILGINITNETPLRVGDVITYNNTKGKYLMHRIINISQDDKGDFYTLKGDNNYVVDPDRVRRQEMIYKVAAVVY